MRRTCVAALDAGRQPPFFPLRAAEKIDDDLRETALATVAAKKQEKLIAKQASEWA